MKYCKRFLSLFVAFVLLFGVFSIPVNAEPVPNQLKYWQALYQFSNYTAGIVYSSWGGHLYQGFYSGEELFGDLSTANIDSRYKMFRYSGAVADVNKEVIAKTDQDVTLKVNKLVLRIYDNNTGQSNLLDFNRYHDYSVSVRYANENDEVVYLNKEDYTFELTESANGYINVFINFVAPENINNIQYNVDFRIDYATDEITDFTNAKINFGTLSNIELDVDKETGFLKGIINWIKKISGDISSGFANMVQGIIELPQKLWNLISEGLKGLFVPDEQYMADYSDKWDELLSQRFGAIYQVSAIIEDFASNIHVADKTNTIYLPSVSLEGVGIPFSFGGYDVAVVPEGFNTIVEICKKIISIVCTFLFINGLRKRYDEVMGVEQ